MALQRARLDDDTLGPYVLLDQAGVPRNDLFLQRYTMTSPAIREVVDDQVGDGVDDRSMYVGAAALSVELRLGDTPEAIMGELRPYLSPRRRPRLVVWDDAWAQDRRLVLRGVSWPGERSGVLDRIRDVQLQWTVPSGTWEADALTEVTIAAATGGDDGVTFPADMPLTFPTTAVSGAADVVNAGELEAPFVARLYGPCIGPRLTNDENGESVAFTSELVLGAGEFVEIDTYAQTAYLSGSTDSSVLPMLDFENSTWWHLPAGTTSVRYNPLAGVVVGSVAVIEFRQRWL